MIKLNRHVTALENTQEKIEERIETIRTKIEAIEEKAFDEDRDLTRAEQNRIFTFLDNLDELQTEYNEIQNAIDYLKDYCDWYGGAKMTNTINTVVVNGIWLNGSGYDMSIYVYYSSGAVKKYNSLSKAPKTVKLFINSHTRQHYATDKIYKDTYTREV